MAKPVHSMIRVFDEAKSLDFYARAFGLLDPTFNSVQKVSAVAQAAHRPRDVAIILDYSKTSFVARRIRDEIRDVLDTR